jgi:molybdate/tungstate transport system substrate-binding protein
MTKQRSGRTRRTRRAFLAGVGVSASVLAGCSADSGRSGGDGDGGGGDAGKNGVDGPTGTGTTGREGVSPSGNGGTRMGSSGSTADSITVFHAGSLAPPMEAAGARFEERTGIRVNREAQGSVASTRKITQQGRSADVLGVADYRLLRDGVLPAFGGWYSIFAANELTIAYTADSTGASEVGPGNWWEVLTREDVRFAHSDPAADPNGYRSVMAMMLGAMDFRGRSLYGEDVYDALREQELVPADTETALLGQLRAGALDYAFEYASIRATEDVRTVDLQPRVDLSREGSEFARFYENAAVEAGGNTYVGAPIAYGITVPSVANAPEAGRRFVEFVLGEAGDRITDETGFTPIDPAIVPRSARQATPEAILEVAEPRRSLGSLALDVGHRPPTHRSATANTPARTPWDLLP